MRSALPTLLLLALLVRAQEAPPNGPRRVDPMWHALTGATVHTRPGEALDGATVVLKEGRIESVGGPVPQGARLWDCKGLHLYAGFLDAYVETDAKPYKGEHWNGKVMPDREAGPIPNAVKEELRKLGFCAGAASPKGGIFRGSGGVESLAPEEADPSVPRPATYRAAPYRSASFEFHGNSNEGYPTSQMGAIAVLRQTLSDGLVPPGPLLFDCDDELEALRGGKIAREFRRDAIVLGCGTEFRRLEAIAAARLPVVVPLRLPRVPEVTSVAAQNAVDLRDLMTWEQAPFNAFHLDAAGVAVSLTTAKLDKRERFLPALRRTRLAEARALAMLTTNPARLLGVGARLGEIAPGMVANLALLSGPLLDKESKVLDVWIDGRRFEIALPETPLHGRWTVDLLPPSPVPLELVVRRDGKGDAVTGETKTALKRIDRQRERVGITFGETTLSGVVDGESMRGHGVRADGTRFAWSARRTAPEPPEESPAKPETPIPALTGTPFGPYALMAPPEQPARVVFRGMTLWTCGPAGVVEDAEMEIAAGVVRYAGVQRPGDPTCPVVDLRGRHVTPGIVDCHSHTGISKGVNDSGQAVTAEVRIGDVTNPDSISWYRQLAGGVTTVNSLHGSANPIGGQNQVNKNRWGAVTPDAMHFEGAPPGIKFALGENVKQSNWGDQYTTRYPQTRMGVEALIRDRFVAAREYARGHARRDLELEALAGILAGTRLVHCHSYRQDEILMLCRVAKEFGFRIGTFQHVLEGYKVADAIREAAIGASAFSDWWAYKVEVQDAIPENGAIMHEVGVNVSFNSDSDDLARRLNVEAAKAVRYGGVSREEALKFVTLNPAIQLGIAARVGSLEAGKDADFAVWSGDPLSTMSRCEATWVDGREYFSTAQDLRHRERIAAERTRLLALALAHEPHPGELEEPLETPPPAFARCGECGCTEGAR